MGDVSELGEDAAGGFQARDSSTGDVPARWNTSGKCPVLNNAFSGNNPKLENSLPDFSSNNVPGEITTEISQGDLLVFSSIGAGEFSWLDTRKIPVQGSQGPF